MVDCKTGHNISPLCIFKFTWLVFSYSNQKVWYFFTLWIWSGHMISLAGGHETWKVIIGIYCLEIPTSEKSWMMVHDRLCRAKRNHFSHTPADEDFPGGPVVKNPPANAGDKGLIPGPGRFHMLRDNKACASQLLSQHPRTCELKPVCLQPVLSNKRSHFNEKSVYPVYIIALTHHNWRKPACSNEDPTQPYINQS